MSSTDEESRSAGPAREHRPASPAHEHPETTFPSAPVPRRLATAGVLGMLLAVLLVVVGVLALHDGVLLLGWVAGGQPILSAVLTGPARFGPHALSATVAALVALLGLWLLWSALRPGRRTGLDLGTRTGVWMTRGDLERIVAGTARECDGVLQAHARAGRRRVVIDAVTTTADIEGAVRDTVTERLSGLPSAPKVVVRATAKYDERSER